MSITTWRKEIDEIFKTTGDSWAHIESNTLTEIELDAEFLFSRSQCKGEPFTLWTRKRVYFPVVCDGQGFIAYVSRNPDGEPTMLGDPPDDEPDDEPTIGGE